MKTIRFNRIANIRIDNDYTQSMVAHNIFNIPRSTYKRWEIGLSPFPIDKLNTFVNYFNVSFDYLCGLTNSHQKVYCAKINSVLISKRLKHERIKRNYLQKEIIQVIGVAQNTYSDYENYKKPNTPTITTLYKLAKFYNISLDYLCGRTDYSKSFK